MATRTNIRERSRFELFSWLFMRISGIVLLVMAVYHLVLMHYTIGVENLSFEIVADRFAGPWWRLYDFFLLAFALLHGANGARIVIEDYVRRDAWRLFAKVLLILITFVLLVMGTWILVTFEVPA